MKEYVEDNMYKNNFVRIEGFMHIGFNEKDVVKFNSDELYIRKVEKTPLPFDEILKSLNEEN